jgi:hypothetical protein
MSKPRKRFSRQFKHAYNELHLIDGDRKVNSAQLIPTGMTTSAQILLGRLKCELRNDQELAIIGRKKGLTYADGWKILEKWDKAFGKP